MTKDSKDTLIEIEAIFNTGANVACVNSDDAFYFSKNARTGLPALPFASAWKDTFDPLDIQRAKVKLAGGTKCSGHIIPEVRITIRSRFCPILAVSTTVKRVVASPRFQNLLGVEALNGNPKLCVSLLPISRKNSLCFIYDWSGLILFHSLSFFLITYSLVLHWFGILFDI